MNRRNFLRAATGCAVAMPVIDFVKITFPFWTITTNDYDYFGVTVKCVKAIRTADGTEVGFGYEPSSDSFESERREQKVIAALNYAMTLADWRKNPVVLDPDKSIYMMLQGGQE